MSRKIIWVISCIFLGLLLSGCEKHIKGDGNKTTATRSVDTFNAIEIDGNYQLNVVAGKTQQVTVTTDSNLIPYVETQIKDKILIVKTKKGAVLDTNEAPMIDIAVQNLKALTINGNGSATVTGIKADEFDLNLNGAGSANLSGNTNDFELKLSGNGDINANNLIANQAEVKLNGNGNITVYASKQLEIKLNGAGKVQYYGEPRQLDQKISGNGEVIGIPLNAEKSSS